jgi:hypothetical protein
MQLDVERSFYLCNSPLRSVDPPTAEGALAQANCSSIVTFYIYDPSGVQAAAAALQAEAEGEFALITGDNWVITCLQVATCEKIHAVTGGELTTP